MIAREWNSANPIRSAINAPTFLDTHYTAAEQSLILTTTVNTGASYSDPAQTSLDKLFLLSETEATSLFANDAARIAKLNGTASNWWLRSHRAPGGNSNSYACAVGTGGTFGNGQVQSLYGVRPAFWVDLR